MATGPALAHALFAGARARDNACIATPLAGRPASATLGGVPAHHEAEALARALLGSEGTRLAHVRTAGRVAQHLGVLFDGEESALLVAAATLHDIGYSARIAHVGFHPLDGALFLRAQGYSERLAGLVAHHSLARMTAGPDLVAELDAAFPREDSLLADALAYADMHSGPDGSLIHTESRLAGIALRHAGREQPDRAGQLRAAIARVGEALIASAAVPVPRSAAEHRAGSGRVPAHVLAAFESWWRAETRYRIAWQEFAVDRRAEDSPSRDHAVRLAALRGQADRRRDQYFRSVLR